MIDLGRLFDVGSRALLLGGVALCAVGAGASQARADGFELVDSAAPAPAAPAPQAGFSLIDTPAAAAPVKLAQLAPRPSPAAAALAPSLAASMQSAMTTAPAAVAPPVDDGLGQNGFYLEADLVIQDDTAKTVTAEGNVEVRYRGRVLRAQTLTYRHESGVVEAKGDVQILNPDGTAQFAKEVVLDDDLRAGVAIGFSARLENNVKIAGATAVRRSPTVDELNKAIYTPCDICHTDGSPKTPTWSVKAERVVQDGDRKVVYYQNAVLQLFGIPVLYAPYFWHAGPQSGRKSGLLAPRFSASNKRGFSYEQPYYLAISPSQDLVLSPMFSAKVNPFLNGEWRKLFSNGEIGARFGYTYDSAFDNSGDPIPGSPSTSRSYILANGAWRPNDLWTFGFSAERASDDLLFDRYDIPDVYTKRGLFETDTRRLLSQLYAVRQDQTSYVSISALNFQGLQIGDRNAAFPVVAPLIEARWAPDTMILGGRARFEGSAVILARQEDPVSAALPGIDSRRATAEAEWRRTFTFASGVRVEPFVMGRFDAYNVDGLGPGLGAETSTRTLGTVGAEASWPFIRQSGSTTVILEPIVQLAVSPNPDLNPNIPNEDTADMVFDETNLFDPNRAPGFDLYDGGARMNVGGRASFYWGDNRQARVLVGKSLRDEPNRLLPTSSGYRESESDWIVAASATPLRGLTFYGRTRLDPDDFEMVRSEAGASVVMPRIQGYARYLNDRTDPFATIESAEAAADIYFTRNWGVVLYGQKDLKSSDWTRRDIGIVYRDECTRIEVVYHREAGSPRLGGPSESVQLRLTLATLGDPGYRDSGRW